MTAALEGGEWSAARPGRTLAPGKTRYPLYRRLGGPQGWSRRAKNLFPSGILSRTVQPVAQSLYRLSYAAHTRSKADANSSERKQIAFWVSSAYATTSQMLAATSRMFSYLYSTPFCGIGGERTTDVYSGGGAASV